MNELFRHPEWKRLYDELRPTLKTGDILTYDELSSKSGLDIRSPRGRQQFYRCAQEILVTLSLWVENVPNQGYRVISASEHGTSARKRVSRARRQIRRGVKIAAHVRLEEMTDDQRRANADLLVRLARLEGAVKDQSKEIRQLAASIDTKRLPSPVMDHKA